jgi:hypothetical protein
MGNDNLAVFDIQGLDRLGQLHRIQGMNGIGILRCKPLSAIGRSHDFSSLTATFRSPLRDGFVAHDATEPRDRISRHDGLLG